MDSFDADDFPIAAKALANPLATIMGLSGQFEFTEYPTPPNANTAYQVIVSNFDGSEVLFVSLFGDGSVLIQAGNPASIPTYIGVWTPNGGTHVVHFSVDGAGVPTLYIDGVPIPMPFIANLPSFGSLYPVNSITYGGGSGDATPAVSPLFGLFLTAGAVGPSTEFCCPAA